MVGLWTYTRCSVPGSLGLQSRFRLAVERTILLSVPLPLFITCTDHVECWGLLVARLEALDDIANRVVLIDNDSEGKPIVKFGLGASSSCRSKRERVDITRCGSADIHPTLHASGFFVVTDPDVIPDTKCPRDAVTVLRFLFLTATRTLRRRDWVSESTTFPPGSGLSRDVGGWESQFWEFGLEPGVFDAQIDTTFAVYGPGAPGADYTPGIENRASLRRSSCGTTSPTILAPKSCFTGHRTHTTGHLSNLPSVLQPHFAAKLDRQRRRVHRLADHPLLDASSAKPDPRDQADSAGGHTRVIVSECDVSRTGLLRVRS